MGLLTTLGTGQGYLKAGFLGFGGSGKTWTAALLAIGAREHFQADGPVAMFDTEGGSEYIGPMMRKAIGKEMVGIKSRSFDDLLKVGEECVASEVSVLLVDSVTHIWRELCDAYMKQINERLASQKRPRRQRLEFQDWAHVKAIWERWTSFYLNAPLHIIICGRAGYEYNFEENDDGKKELVKTGVKMKTEGEFGFEPSLLVEMEREQVPDGAGGFTMHHRATVIKDRFGVIDGASILDPTFKFFEPHVGLLKPSAHTPIDTAVKTDAGVDEDGDSEWSRERKTRVILCEEIQGELVNAYPGQDAASKKAKTDLIHMAFGTRSWTAVESKPSAILRAGLQSIRYKLNPPEAAPALPIAEDTDPETAERHSLIDRLIFLKETCGIAPDAYTKQWERHCGKTTVEAAPIEGLRRLAEVLEALAPSAA